MGAGKAILIVGFVAIVVFAWMFRYDHPPSMGEYMRVDRWTGKTCLSRDPLAAWACGYPPIVIVDE